MKIYWQDLNSKKPDAKKVDAKQIIEALQNNEILITTTDTVPGLLANTTSHGFAALNKIKQDRQNKPYIILISDAKKLDNFVDTQQFTPQIKNLIEQCWPGPLTIIFKAKKNLPSFLKSEQDTVAIRCPNYTPLLEILKHFNGLYSTSANSSYNPAPKSINDVDDQVTAQVKYLIDDKDITEQATQASTIIDISQAGQVKIIRQGAYTKKDLKKNLGKLLD